MKFLATAIPIAAPTPEFPTATDAAAAPTPAMIAELLSARTSTRSTGPDVPSTTLFSIDAIVRVSTTFVDSDAAARHADARSSA